MGQRPAGLQRVRDLTLTLLDSEIWGPAAKCAGKRHHPQANCMSVLAVHAAVKDVLAIIHAMLQRLAHTSADGA